MLPRKWSHRGLSAVKRPSGDTVSFLSRSSDWDDERETSDYTNGSADRKLKATGWSSLGPYWSPCVVWTSLVLFDSRRRR